jgi:hypothetical protein
MRSAICGLTVFALACTTADDQLTPARTEAIRVEIEKTLRDAYDLSKAGVAERMLSLYPPSGRVVSATGGSVFASRDSIETGIRYFWNNVGINMRDPRWVWDRFYIDVLSPNAAVATATYKIPHRTPRNEPHVLGGAMTAVFERRGGRWVIIQEHLSDLPQTPSDSAIARMPTHDHH